MKRRRISVLDAVGHEMHKQIFAALLLPSIGLGAAVAQESHVFTMELKPIQGAEGAATMIHAEETVNGGTPIDGTPSACGLPACKLPCL